MDAWFRDPRGRPAGVPLWPFWNCMHCPRFAKRTTADGRLAKQEWPNKKPGAVVRAGLLSQLCEISDYSRLSLQRQDTKSCVYQKLCISKVAMSVAHELSGLGGTGVVWFLPPCSIYDSIRAVTAVGSTRRALPTRARASRPTVWAKSLEDRAQRNGTSGDFTHLASASAASSRLFRSPAPGRRI